MKRMAEGMSESHLLTAWIVPEVQLPADGERVLVVVRSDAGTRKVTIAWYFSDGGWRWRQIRGTVSHPERRITHWQSLPTVPVELGY